MAAFNVSDVDLSAYGYNDKVNLVDPMFDQFRAKAFSGTDLAQVKAVTLPFFQNLNAYPNAQLVNGALSSFYKTALPTATNFKRAEPTTLKTTTAKSKKTTSKPATTSSPTTTSNFITTGSSTATSSVCYTTTGTEKPESTETEKPEITETEKPERTDGTEHHRHGGGDA